MIQTIAARSLLAVSLALGIAAPLAAQTPRPPDAKEKPIDAEGNVGGQRNAPDRRPGEGDGPFDRLVIRGITMIDGTGGTPPGSDRHRHPGQPHRGGEERRISRRRHRARAAAAKRRPARSTGPGCTSCRASSICTSHGGGPQAPDAEYVYKLWMAHGVTTVRGVPCGRLDWTLARPRAQRQERDRRAAHLRLSRSGSPATAGTRASRRPPRPRASGCAGSPRRASTASSSSRSIRRSWRRSSTRRRRTDSVRRRTSARSAWPV